MAVNLLASALMLLAYAVACKHTGSYINIFTPYFAIIFPSRFVLDLIYFSLTGQEGQLTTYIAVYATTILEFTGIIIGFILTKNNIILKSILGRTPTPTFGKAVLTLIFAVLIFFPTIIEYKDYLLSPRNIYTQTRTGSGASFFISITLSYISFILFLLSHKKPLIPSITYISILATSLLLHGNKAPIIVLLFIYLTYSTTIKGKVFTFASSLRYGLITTGFILALFSATLSENMKENLLLGIASYSDYNRNYALVIDSPPPLQLGKLTFEGTFISLIPRAIFPEKPKNFGTFFLAERYYPEWFYLDTGSPAFGFGVTYADFGKLTFFYIFLTSTAIGALLRIFYNRARTQSNAGDFIMVLFLAGTPILELGSGYHIIPHIVIAFLLNLFIKLNWKLFQKKRENHAQHPHTSF